MMPGARLIARARANPANAARPELLPARGLNQGFLTTRCLFQEVSNHRAGHLSFDAGYAVIRELRQATTHLAAKVEVRNQVRVHLC